MSKTIKKNGRAAKGGPSSLPSGAPEKNTVVGWVRKDLEAAHYLLGLVLMRYPSIIEEMGEQVYAHIMKKEQGAAIDHVNAPGAAETGLD